MLLSIIVPVYNAENYIDECVRSVINQTFGDFELILVNDGSTDSSLLHCKRWEKEDKRIKLIDKRNGGVSSARNAGLNIASGTYIGFVDSDDYIESTMYEKLVNAAMLYNADIAICKRIIPGKKRNYGHHYPQAKVFMFSDQYTEWKKLFYQGDLETFVTNKVFRSKMLIESAVQFREYPVLEDRLFLSELFLQNPRMVFIDDVLYYYRSVEDSSIHKYHRDKYEIIRILYHFNKRIHEKYDYNIDSSLLNSEFLYSIVNCILQSAEEDQNTRTLLFDEISKSSEFTFTYMDSLPSDMKLMSKAILYFLYHKKYRMINIILNTYKAIHDTKNQIYNLLNS